MKLSKNAFYCVSCRHAITLPNDVIDVELDRNGRPRIVAICPHCDTKLYKYISEKSIIKY